MEKVRPKKHLGQHFLTDLGIAENIAKAVKGHKGVRKVLEIGPGMGVLTDFLITQQWDLYLLDIDPESIAYLHKKYPGLDEKIIEGDFLNHDIGKIIGGEYIIAGNFPYNISSQIFFKILPERNNVVEVVCMLQKEVAKRIASPKGNKDYGILSVLLQAFYDIEYLFNVPPDVFDPPPKVNSGVIRLIRNEVENLGCDEKLFFRVVKQAFSMRRKTLRNALKPMGLTEEMKEEAVLDKRAEQLGVEEFVRLTNKLAESLEKVNLFELSKEYLESLKESISEGDADFIRISMEGANEADVASLLDELDMEEALFVLRTLDHGLSADVLIELDEDPQYRVIKAMEPQELALLIDNMDSDDAVDVLNQLILKDREEVMSFLQEKEKAAHILDLLRYDEDSAGGLMAKELIKANINWTVVQTIDEIRRQAENVEKIHAIYVVGNKEKLLGRVSLKKIILSSSNTQIADIYDNEIISVPTYMDQEEVAEIMRKYDLEAVPVVNIKNKLVGRITVDDILDVIREQVEEDIQAMTGISEDVEESDSVYKLSKARLPWLLIGMVGGLLGAGFIGFFEEGLNAVTALAFFIPLITATGGNVGIQSSSLVVQTLANRSIFEESLGKRFARVLMVALLNGLVLALFVFMTITFIYGESYNFGAVVSIALFSVVILASFMGTFTPIVLDKVGINPAMASGPFITTANDLIGLGVYFAVATLLLKL